MARGRIIDKEIHRDTDLGELSISARYLFKGTIIHADDEGRMKADARYLCATIFPYDPPIDDNGILLELKVQEWRDNLAAKGLIVLYDRAGRKYLEHHNWKKWQPLRRDRFHPSDCPAPTDDGCHVVDIRLPNCPRVRTEPNLTEPNQTEVKKERAQHSRSHFLKPTAQEVTEYAKTMGFALDGQHFVDWYEARGWLFKTGQPMKDWKATVRTWKKQEKNHKGEAKEATWMNQ